LNLKFYNAVKNILENQISPFVSRSQPVAAKQGTNIGMTTGDMLHTFPNSLQQVPVVLPKKKKKIKQKKTS
jgi:hypothetical protein